MGLNYGESACDHLNYQCMSMKRVLDVEDERAP